MLLIIAQPERPPPFAKQAISRRAFQPLPVCCRPHEYPSVLTRFETHDQSLDVVLVHREPDLMFGPFNGLEAVS